MEDLIIINEDDEDSRARTLVHINNESFHVQNSFRFSNRHRRSKGSNNNVRIKNKIQIHIKYSPRVTQRSAITDQTKQPISQPNYLVGVVDGIKSHIGDSMIFARQEHIHENMRHRFERTQICLKYHTTSDHQKR